jgi:hypothetical protein
MTIEKRDERWVKVEVFQGHFEHLFIESIFEKRSAILRCSLRIFEGYLIFHDFSRKSITDEISLY